nr:response regulator [Anaerolineae bacterium]
MADKILYVEDEIAIIDLIRRVVSHPEVTLVSMTHTPQGLAKKREVKPGLVILDISGCFSG